MSIPSFKWAEDKEKVYLTIELGDVKDAKVDLEKQAVKFTGNAHKQAYTLDLQLRKTIDVEKSSWAAKDRQVEILLRKEHPGKEFWIHLLADKNAYKSKIKVDWEHWHDEDEEDAKPQFGNDFGMGGMGGMGGMDFGGMGGMGGFGGDDAGGDSDDEDLPGLENAGKDEEDGDGDADEEVNADAPKTETKAEEAKPAEPSS